MSQLATTETTLELVPTGAIEALTRGEIDIQISTAHKYPRSMQPFKKRATEMATLDEETAASCIYSRPVGGGKNAEGLSVRMAEIVGASYGNLRVGAMIVEQTPRFVKVRGFAHDLESNFASSCDVIESTIKKDGTPYDERMRIVIAKAALAKARRDATFQVVPKALCKCIEVEARRVAIGDATTLTKRREQVMMWIGKLGIDKARVFAAIGVSGEDDIGLDELLTLTGLKTSIKDGDVTIDEAFPNIIPAGRVGKTASTAATAEKMLNARKAMDTDASPHAQEIPRDAINHARLREMLKGANITEAQLVTELHTQGMIDPDVTFATLPEPIVGQLLIPDQFTIIRNLVAANK
jgi:hypothetical protein